MSENEVKRTRDALLETAEQHPAPDVAVQGEPVAYASHGVNHILAERMAKHNKETGNAND